MKINVEAVILTITLGLFALFGAIIYQCEKTKRHTLDLMFEMEKLKLEQNERR